MTKMSGGVVLALAVAVGLAASPLQAQRGQGFGGRGAAFEPGRMGGPNMGRSLDVLLENQEKLDLTGDQLRELEELKATMDREVSPLAEEMTALRERIQAGEVDRTEGFRQMQALQGRLLIASAPLQGRVQEILTVDQHLKLQSEMRQGRPGQGRGGMAMREGANQRRGGRGGGIGPQQGMNGRGGAFAQRMRPGFRRGGEIDPQGQGNLFLPEQ